MLRLRPGAPLPRTVHRPSHILPNWSENAIQRRFVKFPRIFDRQKPEIVAPASVNLHDQNTGFTNFIKNLDSHVAEQNLSIDSLTTLFERFEVSVSDDIEHLVKVLGSYDTPTLLYILDSLTFYLQTRTSKNISILVNNLCGVLATRTFISAEDEEVDTTQATHLLTILNRINHKPPRISELVQSLNKQIRSNCDILIENGSFTHLCGLLAYTLDPNTVYAIVHTCLNKLGRLKPTDYSTLPQFLFNFKIHNDNVLEGVISHAATSPMTVFGSDPEAFTKFVEGLFLFKGLYDNRDLTFNPLSKYLLTMRDAMAKFTPSELSFILSGLPSQGMFNSSLRDDYINLVDGILVQIGVVSDDGAFQSLSHLDNSHIVSLVKHLNKRELHHTGVQWKQVKALILKGHTGKNYDKTVKSVSDNSFLNEFARDLSARFLREVPQNCRFNDVDDLFKSTDSIDALLLFIDRLLLANVESIYTNSLTLSAKRLLSLMESSDFHELDLIKFFSNVSKLNAKTLGEVGLELYKLSKRGSLQLLEKGLRFKLLHLKGASPSEPQEILEDLPPFEALRETPGHTSFVTLLSLIELISKASNLCSETHRQELGEWLKKFSSMAHEALKTDLNLLTFKSVPLLLFLPPGCDLLKEVDGLTDSNTPERLPQLAAVFIYRLSRLRSGVESREALAKLGQRMEAQLADLVDTLETTFTQRVCALDPGDNNLIRRINPWVNEHGLKYLVKRPMEQLDLFLYDKCPKLDSFFHMYRHKEREGEFWEDARKVDSFYDLRRELGAMNKLLTREESSIGLENADGAKTNEHILVTRLAAGVRRALLAVEMCRPVSRDYRLPKRHVQELVKLSLRKFTPGSDISAET